MESIMCERNEEIAMQRSLEEQTSLDEIIKQANCSLDSQELFNQCLAVVAENECFDKDVNINLQIIVVVGCFTNKTKEPLSILASHKYAGHIVKNFPNPLNSSGAFTMSAMSDKGIKAAMVYSGRNKVGVECGWLLAFADTKATGRRIYAECGHKGKFSNINWEQVEQELDKAGEIAKVYDNETRTSLYAGIVGTTGKSAVGAAFLG